MRLIMPLLMFAWGTCLLLIPALKEFDGRILGNIWVAGGVIVGVLSYKK